MPKLVPMSSRLTSLKRTGDTRGYSSAQLSLRTLPAQCIPPNVVSPVLCYMGSSFRLGVPVCLSELLVWCMLMGFVGVSPLVVILWVSLLCRLDRVVTSECMWTCVVFRPEILLTPSMAQTPLDVLRTLRIRLAARVLRL